MTRLVIFHAQTEGESGDGDRKMDQMNEKAVGHLRKAIARLRKEREETVQFINRLERYMRALDVSEQVVAPAKSQAIKNKGKSEGGRNAANANWAECRELGVYLGRKVTLATKNEAKDELVKRWHGRNHIKVTRDNVLEYERARIKGAVEVARRQPHIDGGRKAADTKRRTVPPSKVPQAQTNTDSTLPSVVNFGKLPVAQA